jgi:tRNA threonylcarbamoyl adenosine modification protein (Sua5/YciO/YrdC/YwlC family)
MLLKANPQNPQPRVISKAVELLKNGGVLIIPTDTVYAFACDVYHPKAVQKLHLLRGIDEKNKLLSIICSSVSIIGQYATGVDTPTYKLLKSALPGPYTFILKASKEIPPQTLSKRKTIGIRVVDNKITNLIVESLGNPILVASLKDDDDPTEYKTDPELIHLKYGKLVDAVIDGGPGGTIPSTVIDVSDGFDHIQILREGLGSLEKLNIAVREEE